MRVCLHVLFIDRSAGTVVGNSFNLWLCCICIADMCLCVSLPRVLPGERAPEGESEMLPAAPVWSRSSR